MTSFKHSIVLFVSEDGKAMEFCLRPCEERVNLKLMIEHGGGVLHFRGGRDVIRLVEQNSKVINLEPEEIAVSVKFIYDCVEQNSLLDLNTYAVHINSDETSDISEDDYSVRGTHSAASKFPAKYSKQEDTKIIDFLLKNRNKYLNSSKVEFIKILKSSVLESRTLRSLEKRITILLSNIDALCVSKEKKHLLKSLVQKGNKKFTKEDDMKILQFILANEAIMSGIKMFSAIAKTVVPPRTGKSIENRFHYRIMPQIHSYGLATWEVKKLCDKFTRRYVGRIVNKVEVDGDDLIEDHSSDETEVNLPVPRPAESGVKVKTEVTDATDLCWVVLTPLDGVVKVKAEVIERTDMNSSESGSAKRKDAILDSEVHDEMAADSPECSFPAKLNGQIVEQSEVIGLSTRGRRNATAVIGNSQTRNQAVENDKRSPVEGCHDAKEVDHSTKSSCSSSKLNLISDTERSNDSVESFVTAAAESRSSSSASTANEIPDTQVPSKIHKNTSQMCKSGSFKTTLSENVPSESLELSLCGAETVTEKLLSVVASDENVISFDVASSVDECIFPGRKKKKVKLYDPSIYYLTLPDTCEETVLSVVANTACVEHGKRGSQLSLDNSDNESMISATQCPTESKRSKIQEPHGNSNEVYNVAGNATSFSYASTPELDGCDAVMPELDGCDAVTPELDGYDMELLKKLRSEQSRVGHSQTQDHSSASSTTHASEKHEETVEAISSFISRCCNSPMKSSLHKSSSSNSAEDDGGNEVCKVSGIESEAMVVVKDEAEETLPFSDDASCHLSLALRLIEELPSQNMSDSEMHTTGTLTVQKASQLAVHNSVQCEDLSNESGSDSDMDVSRIFTIQEASHLAVENNDLFLPKERRLFINEAMSLVKTLEDAVASMDEQMDPAFRHGLREQIYRLKLMLYKPFLRTEAEKVMKKQVLTLQDKAILVRYLSVAQKATARSILHRVVNQS